MNGEMGLASSFELPCLTLEPQNRRGTIALLHKNKIMIRVENEWCGNTAWGYTWPTCAWSLTPFGAVSVEERCRMAHDYGLCHGSQLQWFYDHRSQLCRSFQYSGCGGNANRFESYGACSAVCSDLNVTSTSARPTAVVTPYQPKYIHSEAPINGSQPEAFDTGAANLVPPPGSYSSSSSDSFSLQIDHVFRSFRCGRDVPERGMVDSFPPLPPQLALWEVGVGRDLVDVLQMLLSFSLAFLHQLDSLNLVPNPNVSHRMPTWNQNPFDNSSLIWRQFQTRVLMANGERFCPLTLTLGVGWLTNITSSWL